MKEETVFKIRNRLTEVIANALAAYHNNVCYSSPKCILCQSTSQLAQLNLPESLSLLPLFLNAALKSPLFALSPMNTSARIDTIYPRGDQRAYWKWVGHEVESEG